MARNQTMLSCFNIQNWVGLPHFRRAEEGSHSSLTDLRRPFMPETEVYEEGPTRPMDSDRMPAPAPLGLFLNGQSSGWKSAMRPDM